MDDYAALSFHDLLDEVARRTPTPGGGGVAAGAGCLACVMARMVAAYSIGPKTEAATRARIEAVSGRLEVADQLLRALITQDAEAYAAMAAVSKSSQDEALGRQRFTEAILQAIAVPMEAVAVTVNLLAILDDFKEIANRRLLSDLGVAAVLADAAARAASYSVRINLPELPDTELRASILAELEDHLLRAGQSRRSIEEHVRTDLEGTKPESR